MKIVIVYNPVSGSGSGRKCALELYEYIINKENVIELIESKSKEDLQDSVIKLASIYDLMFICGGDGTLRDAIEAVQMSGYDIPLAIIPAGSGNDFAKSIGVNGDIKYLADIYLKSEDMYVYGITCNDKHLINVFGVGIDTAILKRRLSYKLLRGPFSYMVSALATIFTYKPRRYKIQMDDLEVENNYYIVAVCNGKYFGGGMMIGPDADINSEYFQVLALRNVGFFKLLKAFSCIYKGKHTDLDYIDSYKSKVVNIDLLDGKELYNIDGDIYLENKKIHLKKSDKPSIRLRKPYI